MCLGAGASRFRAQQSTTGRQRRLLLLIPRRLPTECRRSHLRGVLGEAAERACGTMASRTSAAGPMWIETTIRCSNGRARAAVAAAAGVPALLYFLFVLHYSVNVPWGVDDWSMIPVVDSVLHGHLGLNVLWSQYGDRRLVVSRLVFVAFGLTDHLNEQFVMLSSALTFIGAYFAFLLNLRAYLGKKLTILPVFVLGVGIVVYTWASVPDLRRPRSLPILGAGTLAVFLIAQGILATEYGFAGAGVRHQMFQSDVRVLANRERIPSTKRGCFEAIALVPPISPLAAFYFYGPIFDTAARDRLSLFSGPAFQYRALGPPLISECDRT